MLNDAAIHGEPSARAPFHRDRRKVGRHLPHPATACRFFTSLGGPSSPVTVQDVSTHGIGLLLPHPLPPGEVLTSDLVNAERNFARIKWLRVVHATEQSPGCWVLGCAFEERLRERDLEALC